MVVLWLAGLLLALFILASFAAYVTQDLNRRGIKGWIVGILVVFAPPIGIPAFLVLRLTRPITDHDALPPPRFMTRRLEDRRQ